MVSLQSKTILTNSSPNFRQAWKHQSFYESHCELEHVRGRPSLSSFFYQLMRFFLCEEDPHNTQHSWEVWMTHLDCWVTVKWWCDDRLRCMYSSCESWVSNWDSPPACKEWPSQDQNFLPASDGQPVEMFRYSTLPSVENSHLTISSWTSSLDSWVWQVCLASMDADSLRASIVATTNISINL